MDKIVFETRREIGDVSNALSQQIKEHGENETLQRLIHLLDAMYISW